jgi:hypothetical protein
MGRHFMIGPKWGLAPSHPGFCGRLEFADGACPLVCGSSKQRIKRTIPTAHLWEDTLLTFHNKEPLEWLQSVQNVNLADLAKLRKPHSESPGEWV